MVPLQGTMPSSNGNIVLVLVLVGQVHWRLSPKVLAYICRFQRITRHRTGKTILFILVPSRTWILDWGDSWLGPARPAQRPALTNYLFCSTLSEISAPSSYIKSAMPRRLHPFFIHSITGEESLFHRKKCFIQHLADSA